MNDNIFMDFNDRVIVKKQFSNVPLLRENDRKQDNNNRVIDAAWLHLGEG